MVNIGDREWSMYRCNAQCTASPNLQWSNETGGLVSCPAVVAGRVYIGSDDKHVYCFDAASGSLKWSYASTSKFGGDACPAIARGKMYISSQDDGKLYCFDAVSGSLLWVNSIGGTLSSPAVTQEATSQFTSKNMLYTGSTDKNIYCIDGETGAIKWKYTTGGAIHSSPAIYSNNVYIGSDDKNVYCFNTSGALKWQHQTVGAIPSSPTIEKDVVYIVSRVSGSDKSTLYALNTQTGAEIWPPYTSMDMTGIGESSTPIVSNGIIYINGMFLSAIDASTGLFKWKAGNGPIGGPIDHIPGIANGVVYVCDQWGVTMGGSYGLIAYDALTGQQKWSRILDRPGAAGTRTVVSQGQLYIGAGNKVHRYDPTQL